jgi:hypothetical protein
MCLVWLCGLRRLSPCCSDGDGRFPDARACERQGGNFYHRGTTTTSVVGRGSGTVSVMRAPTARADLCGRRAKAWCGATTRYTVPLLDRSRSIRLSCGSYAPALAGRDDNGGGIRRRAAPVFSRFSGRYGAVGICSALGVGGAASGCPVRARATALYGGSVVACWRKRRDQGSAGHTRRNRLVRNSPTDCGALECQSGQWLFVASKLWTPLLEILTVPLRTTAGRRPRRTARWPG